MKGGCNFQLNFKLNESRSKKKYQVLFFLIKRKQKKEAL